HQVSIKSTPPTPTKSSPHAEHQPSDQSRAYAKQTVARAPQPVKQPKRCSLISSTSASPAHHATWAPTSAAERSCPTYPAKRQSPPALRGPTPTRRSSASPSFYGAITTASRASTRAATTGRIPSPSGSDGDSFHTTTRTSTT